MALDFLRQLGASAGRRAGYRLRRCPVRLPRWGLPAGMGRPLNASFASVECSGPPTMLSARGVHFGPRGRGQSPGN